MYPPKPSAISADVLFLNRKPVETLLVLLFVLVNSDVVDDVANICDAFQIPVVIVPTVVMSVPINLDAAIDPANIVLVTLPAPMATVIDVAPDPDTSPDNVMVSFPDSFELNVIQSAADNKPGWDADAVCIGSAPPGKCVDACAAGATPPVAVMVMTSPARVTVMPVDPTTDGNKTSNVLLANRNRLANATPPMNMRPFAFFVMVMCSR